MADAQTEIFYGVLLDISDNTSDNDSDYGLASGVFYWVTGRPGYTGGGYTGVETGRTWKEGILIDRSKMPDIDRWAEGLEVSGGYGSLSGWTFEVNNCNIAGSTDSFEYYLDSNDYYVVNRPVKVFVFINDVSYYLWEGTVQSVSHDETRFKFVCENKFTNKHKIIPPLVLSETAFPDIDENAIGKTVPVCLGYIKYGALERVRSNINPITMYVGTGGFESTVVPATQYNAANRTMTLLTIGKEFEPDELQGYYIRAIINGNGEFVVITSNTVSGKNQPYAQTTVGITIGKPFSENPVLTTEYPSTIGLDTWFFDVFKFESVGILSNFGIEEYIDDDETNETILKYYDKTAGSFKGVNEILYNTSLTNIGDTGFPGMSLFTPGYGRQGSFPRTTTFSPDEAVLSSQWTSDEANLNTSEFTYIGRPNLPYLIDKAPLTEYEAVFNNLTTDPLYIEAEFTVRLPQFDEDYDFDELYLLPDIYIARSSGTMDLALSLSYKYSLDRSGLFGTTNFIDDAEAFSYTGTSSEYIYFIPRSHFNQATTYTEKYYDSDFDRTAFDLVSNADMGSSNRLLEAFRYVTMKVRFDITCSAAIETITIAMREIALVGVRNIEVTSEKLYTVIKGEAVL